MNNQFEAGALCGGLAITLIVIAASFDANSAHAQNPQPASCTIQILVREHKDVDVIVPCVKREDVIHIMSTFFGRGDERSKQEFDKLLGDGGEMTLQITSKGAKP